MRWGNEGLFALTLRGLNIAAGLVLRFFGGATVFALAVAPIVVQAQTSTGSANLPPASSIAAQDFFRLPDVFRPELSPDGRFALAVCDCACTKSGAATSAATPAHDRITPAWTPSHWHINANTLTRPGLI